MSVPRHIALIPDGNRRWGRRHGHRVGEAHAQGIANVGRIADLAFGAGIEVVTAWWGSPANLTRRDRGEVEAIVAALARWLDGPCDALLAEHQASVTVRGEWRTLCPGLQPAVERRPCPRATGRRLVVLMAYDGRREILAAASEPGALVDEGAFTRALWTGDLPPVDLVIRTGGEPHLSAGFLLWHIADAQLFFSPTLWPAFGADDLRGALEAYATTERRFGA